MQVHQGFSLNRAHLFLSGSRSALVNMEARGEGASMLNRKCVVVRWRDLSSDKFLDLIERGAGAILVILPQINATTDKDTMSVRREGGMEGGGCI